jgi:hypothetical protein
MYSTFQWLTEECVNHGLVSVSSFKYSRSAFKCLDLLFQKAEKNLNQLPIINVSVLVSTFSALMVVWRANKSPAMSRPESGFCLIAFEKRQTDSTLS